MITSVEYDILKYSNVNFDRLEIIIDEQTTIHDIFIPKFFYFTYFFSRKPTIKQSNNQTNAAHQPTLHFEVIFRASDA